jgi:hypothetical protein
MGKSKRWYVIYFIFIILNSCNLFKKIEHPEIYEKYSYINERGDIVFKFEFNLNDSTFKFNHRSGINVMYSNGHFNRFENYLVVSSNIDDTSSLMKSNYFVFNNDTLKLTNNMIIYKQIVLKRK